MKVRRHRLSIALGVLMFWEQAAGNAYEIKTHEELSDRATIVSTLDGYLKDRLTTCWHLQSGQLTCRGFLNGIDQPFHDGKVEELE